MSRHDLSTMQNSKPKQTIIPWLVAGAVLLSMAVVMVYRHRARENDALLQSSAPVTAEPVSRTPSVPHRRTDSRAALAGAAQSMAAKREELGRRRKEVQVRVDRTQAAFASRHRSEAVDPAWSNAKEAELTRLATSDQIKQLGVDARDLNIDCRTSMCRITANFDSTAAGDDWIVLYMNNVAQQVPAASYKYIRNPDGTVTINVYAIGRR
jgi:hypothetical protein